MAATKAFTNFLSLKNPSLSFDEVSGPAVVFPDYRRGLDRQGREFPGRCSIGRYPSSERAQRTPAKALPLDAEDGPAKPCGMDVVRLSACTASPIDDQPVAPQGPLLGPIDP